MKKAVFLAIVSTVVFSCCSLLNTTGFSEIPEASLAMAEVHVPADFADAGEGRQLIKKSCRIQGCPASMTSFPLLAHFDDYPWRRRSGTAPFEVGEEQPGSPQKAFLLNIDKAVFACTENACDHYYRQCGLDIDYTLYSEQVRTAGNEAVIVCRAKIVYQTQGGYRLNSEAGPEISHHALEYRAKYSSRLSLHFHFSEYEQVTEVQLDKLECRVHPGDYLSRLTDALLN